MITYRTLNISELSRKLFKSFSRRQTVTKCLQKENAQWVIRDAPFIDDWSEDDYAFLIDCLKNTLETGGFVCGAFSGGALKGFVSVESTPMGTRGQYLDLSSLHVSSDMRRYGIGRELFKSAQRFAREAGAEKLYISSHSAVETQAFYRSVGCVDAEEYNEEHVLREPYDRQLECRL